LRLLDRFDLRSIGLNSVDYIHLVSEAIKLSAADREAFYGDPKFVDVPLNILLSEDYARQRAALIRPDLAFPGIPPAGIVDRTDPSFTGTLSDTKRPDYDTSYICVVDRRGNAFSATPSDPVMRVAPVIPGTGLIPSARGIQSRVDPNHPACIAPGKRPRLTPNPALVRKSGETVMPFGTPGGDLQTQAMAQAFLNMFVFGFDPQAAVEMPRFYSRSFPDSFSPHTYLPGHLRLESGFPQEVFDALAAKGHIVEEWPAAEWSRTGVCMVMHDLQRGIKIGAADPRRTCYALGW
jgi:gamma-glutamyltranspeptidase / glutathione hydrolase